MVVYEKDNSLTAVELRDTDCKKNGTEVRDYVRAFSIHKCIKYSRAYLLRSNSRI